MDFREQFIKTVAGFLLASNLAHLWLAIITIYTYSIGDFIDVSYIPFLPTDVALIMISILNLLLYILTFKIVIEILNRMSLTVNNSMKVSRILRLICLGLFAGMIIFNCLFFGTYFGFQKHVNTNALITIWSYFAFDIITGLMIFTSIMVQIYNSLKICDQTATYEGDEVTSILYDSES